MKLFFSLFSLSAIIFLSGCGSDNKNRTPPIANSASFITQADTLLTGKVSGTDADRNKLRFRLTQMPSKGSVSLQTNGNFIYTPNSDTTGDDQFNFTVFDGKFTSTAATVTIKIDPLSVNFSDYSRKALNQTQDQEPLSLNTRNAAQDVTDENAYDDLLQ